ncbi:MAG: hypothetical protein AAB602_01875 [Patescibacteria group bacterium]
MHPNEVRGENPSKDKRVDRAEHETAEIDPRKTRQSLKESVMKFDALRATKRKKSA